MHKTPLQSHISPKQLAVKITKIPQQCERASNLGSPWCLVHFSHINILAIRQLVWHCIADCEAVYCHYVAQMSILAHIQQNTGKLALFQLLCCLWYSVEDPFPYWPFNLLKNTVFCRQAGYCKLSKLNKNWSGSKITVWLKWNNS